MKKLITNKKIISFLKINYPQIGNIQKVKFLHKKINSKNYLIISNKGKFVLKYFLDNSKPQKIERMCKILHFCSNSSKVEKPIINKNGTYVNLKEKSYLIKFYSGHSPKGNKKEMEDLTYQLAKLHKSLKKTKISFNYKTDSRLYSILKKSELSQLRSKIIRTHKKNSFDKYFLKNYEFLKKCLDYDSKISSEIDFHNISKQLIHDDLHKDNLLMKNNNLETFIDFITMKKGYIIEDVGFCALRFALIKNIKIKKINEFILSFFKLYLNHNSIPKIQLEHINYFLSRKILHGLSFIIKNHYQNNSSSWDSDFKKYSNLLKVVKKGNLVLN